MMIQHGTQIQVEIRQYENGYEIIAPQGRSRVLNAAIEDECAPVPGIGVINISRIVAKLKKLAEPQRLSLTDDFWRQVIRSGIDEQALKSLTPKKRNRPIILLKRPDEKIDVIDGVLQVHARYRHGLKHVKYYVIDESMAREFIVRFWRQGPTGDMIEFDPMAQEITS